MNYHHDRKIIKTKRKLKFFLIFVVFLFVFFLYLFKWGGNQDVGNLFSRLGLVFWNQNDSGGNFLSRYSHFLKNKKELLTENLFLKEKVKDLEFKSFLTDIVFKENLELKEVLQRKEEKNFINGVILAKPNKTPYDVLIIDIGKNLNLEIGDKVFAYEKVLIGEVVEVYDKSAKLKLYSTPGEKVEALILGGNQSILLAGSGGGMFKSQVLNALPLEKGTVFILPNLDSFPIAVVEKIISDPRDPFVEVYSRSLVNIQEMKFVQVLKGREI